MPYSDDEEHSPSEFYYPDEKVFWFFLQSAKSEQTAVQQSHIINPLLTSFARSVRKTSGNTFPYRPRSRLISPYSKTLFLAVVIDFVVLT
jgi:hypothetical protein